MLEENSIHVFAKKDIVLNLYELVFEQLGAPASHFLCLPPLFFPKGFMEPAEILKSDRKRSLCEVGKDRRVRFQR